MVSLLLDCHDLAARLATDDPPVVLDVRWTLGGPSGVDDYRKGHIPGAHFVDLERELSAPPGPGRHPLPDAASFGDGDAAARRGRGTTGRRLRCGATGASAARAWWLLRYFGHPNVALLDGGYAAWISGGASPWRRARIATPNRAASIRQPGGMPLLDAEGAAAMARDGVLIDARAPERFRGEIEPVDRWQATSPGRAIFLLSKPRMPTAPFLLARCAARAVWRRRCCAGRTGRGVLRLRRRRHRGRLRPGLAGIDAALYAGSWSEWITDPSRPMEVGDPSPARGEPVE